MENDLKKLGRLEVPAPSDEARARAMTAAMAAFGTSEKTEDAPQGNESGRRQSSIATTLWSMFMSRKLMLASSALATLLVVPAAGFITYQMVNDGSVALTSQPATSTVAHAGDERLRQAETSKAKSEATPDTPLVATQPAEKPVIDEDTETTAEVAQDAAAPEPATAAEPYSADASPVVGGSNQSRVMSTRVAKSQNNLGIMPAPAIIAEPQIVRPSDSGDRFTSKDSNPVKSVATDPVSTFSADVDTASYAYARQSIMSGQLPTPDSVRVEEMVNYFPYDWKGPDKAGEAFRANVTVMPTPWNANTQLMHVAIKGYDIQLAQQPPANLVFLIDVSGSMNAPEKLPLLKSAFRLLVNTLKVTDTVSIVVYAGNSGVVLEPTKVSDKAKILDAIDNLQPGGATAGADGIEAAYKLAEKGFQKNGVNRIMLATDGDFNVGPSSDDDLKRLIESKRKSGIFLSVLGFGTGNYNDGLMQTLAQNGNGVAAYIDTLSEAQKTLVQEATGSLFPIAKDVKIQVEFNPARIAEYRLIGYETRAIKREDFNNDKVDAGEIGSGHRVTAIYEVTPVGSPAVLNDDLRYADKDSKPETAAAGGDELAFVKIRYKKPDEDTSNLITMPVKASEAKAAVDEASVDVRFSVAVAAFAQKLKGETQVSNYGWNAIAALAQAARGEDRFGYRSEFLKLVDLAKSLKGE
jgi:Ca-activated chloride channel family protein